MSYTNITRAILALISSCCLLLTVSVAMQGPESEQPTTGLPTKGLEDVADIPAVDHYIKGHPKKRYVLIGHDPEAKVPKKGYGLIVILPGGPGGIEFHGFCKRIHKNAIPKGFLSVQLVSPAWTEWSAKNLIWPTEKSNYKQAEFSTEEHLIDAVAEVQKLVKIDKQRIYAFTWSSGGPAVYATSLHKKSPLKGSFIAMSVFQPGTLPSLKRAKKQRYYILHSPEDFISIEQAELARDELAKHKAKTTLVTYEGGHGWHGDMYGMMRAGFAWLEDGE